MDIIFLLLPGIILLGAVTSYEDRMTGRIRNAWVLAGVAFSIIVVSAYAAFSMASGIGINAGYLIDHSINGALGFLLGIALWRAGLWSAGDGKLFFMYCMLLPLSAYSNGYIELFPSLALLINTFIPLFAVLASKVIVSLIRGGRRAAGEAPLGRGGLLAIPIFAFAFAWLPSYLSALAGVQLGLVPGYISVIVLYYLLSKSASGKARLVLLAALGSLRVIIYGASLFSISFAAEFLLMNVLLVIARALILSGSSEIFTTQTPFSLLRPGMLWAEPVIDEKGSYRKEKAMRRLSNRADAKGCIFAAAALAQKDIDRLMKLKKSGMIGFSTIGVYQTVPFAPLLFAGVLLTLIFRGSMLSAVTMP